MLCANKTPYIKAKVECRRFRGSVRILPADKASQIKAKVECRIQFREYPMELFRKTRRLWFLDWHNEFIRVKEHGHS